MSCRDFVDEIQPHVDRIKDCAKALLEGSTLALCDLACMIMPDCLECVLNGHTAGKYAICCSLYSICCKYFTGDVEVMSEYKAIMKIFVRHEPNRKIP